MELTQQLRLTQQLVMTPQLQMAIKLLQLSRVELMDAIQNELEKNPALEEGQGHVEVNALAPEGADTDSPEREIGDKIPDVEDWNQSLGEYDSATNTSYEGERHEALDFESFTTRQESLQQHLLWQLLTTAFSPEQKKIGSLIIGNLDSKGYLSATVEEIAAAAETAPAEVAAVLAVVQGFEPAGIGARDLKECLLLQVARLGLSDTTLLERIIHNHLNHLQRNDLAAICRGLSVKRDKVLPALDIIKSLEPRPGRLFSEDTTQHIVPDVYVYKLDDEFVILVNDAGLPHLKVSNAYRSSLSKDSKASADTREYIQEKVRSASFLIKSIHQRQKTIYKVMESILKFQRPFFEKGVACLKPMVLREVADDIEMHESTVSRVTTNKYAHTPQGIFELKFFFSGSVSQVQGGAVSSASVRDRIKQILENEDPKKPLSDNKISLMLAEANIKIARRTVAKYREALGVLSTSKRKQF